MLPEQDLTFKPQNRGLKLRVGTDTTKPILWTPEQDTEYFSIGKKRAIRKRKATSEDAYQDISIQDIWQIPHTLADFEFIEPVVVCLRSKLLKLLSQEYMDIVCETVPFYRILLEVRQTLEVESALFSKLTPDELIEFKFLALVSFINRFAHLFTFIRQSSFDSRC